MRELAFAIALALGLAACQINEYHADNSSSITLDNGSGTQERGNNSPSTLNPDVQTGDLSGIPAL